MINNNINNNNNNLIAIKFNFYAEKIQKKIAANIIHISNLNTKCK